MRNISRLLAISVLPVLLLLPRADAIFSATMPRKALAEPLLLLLCGGAVSWLWPWRRRASFAPAAVAGATLLILFWMIPRSIDLTQIYPSINALYVLGFFAAGLLLSHYLPFLPGVARAAYALYVSSMMAALGLLYASQSALLCSAYTLEDQHAFGRMLAAFGLALYLLALASVTRWLNPRPGNR